MGGDDGMGGDEEEQEVEEVEKGEDDPAAEERCRKRRKLSPLKDRRVSLQTAMGRLALCKVETSSYNFNCLAFSCLVASGQIEATATAQSAAKERSNEE